MPFKFKLKKSRQYNVTSKSLFVISVRHLLDTSTTVDCTLSSESTGQECLDNVCQRLTINQPELFGLRYALKGNEDEMRWVDLERPLSRQLQKHAASQRLFLKIMYYVISGVSLITDEVSRYYYFLQLQSDVVDGRITCDPKQAVALARYCRQAEDDGHQKDKHTVDYLKTRLSFPKHLVEAGLLETLTEEVLQQNTENLTQSAAEEFFITACQQLDGYGQEKFSAKDETSAEVMLGVTVSGISVSAKNAYRFFPWRDITNVVNHKRNFNIECTDTEKSVGFALPDADTGRYFWNLCVMQHSFFSKYEQNQAEPSPTNANLFQNYANEFNQSNDNLIESSGMLTSSTAHLYASDPHLHLLPDSVVSSNMSLASHNQHLQQKRQQQQHHQQSQILRQTPYLTPELNTSQSNWMEMTDSNISLNNRVQSFSCLDLSNNNVQANQDRERLKALLPTYRAAPDYETAVQKKYRQEAAQPINVYSGSQPDVYRSIAMTDAIFGQQLQQHHPQPFPDVTQTQSPIYNNSQTQLAPAGIIPAISQHDFHVEGLSHQLHLMQLNRIPQNQLYTGNRFNSTSTPDLALASHRAPLPQPRQNYITGSSPDLMSSRTYQQQLQSQQQLSQHSTAAHQPSNHLYAPHLRPNSQQLSPSYYFLLDNHSAAATKAELLSQKLQMTYQTPPVAAAMHQATSQQHINEPIYENVPSPWLQQQQHQQQQLLAKQHLSTSVDEMRDRTSSIQSAPGGMNFKHAQASNYSLIEKHAGVASSAATTSRTPPPPLSTSSSQQYRHAEVQRTSSNPPMATKFNTSRDSVNEMKPPSSASTSTVAVQQHHLPVENTSFESRADSMERSLNSSDASGSTTTKEKRKRRWGILGGGKTSKQKSATLGRDKEKNKNSSTAAAAEAAEQNFKHRWSTGLPRLQPLSASISKEKLCQILESKLADPQLFMEFERIPKRKDMACYEAALQEDNRIRNFNPNFLPYDDNRVRLTPAKENRLGYVNASHITATVGQRQRFFIIAQGPYDAVSLGTFCQCVWEADVYLIVQLSEEINYVPENTDHCLEYGQFQVWQEFSQRTERCVTSKLRLFHIPSRRYRSIWHLNYTEWTEQNCPRSIPHFLDFLEELSSVRLASVNEVPPGHNTNPPILLHCSEGGGRSGLTLASDLLLYTMDHNQDLDIPRVVGQLRLQRDNIVPSLSQYKSIYALLIQYLKRTRLI